MNVTMTGTPVPPLHGNPTATTPNFVSMVRAELFKLSRQRGIWITGILVVVFFTLASLVYTFEVKAINGQLNNLPGNVSPLSYSLMTQFLNSNTGVRGFIGIFIAVATVFAIALEYQQGTIRVVLARGVGRLRLLAAKLTAVGIVSLGMLVVLLGLGLIVANLDIAWANTGALTLPAYFWSDTLGYVGAVIVSMFATLLLDALFAVLGRNMAFGLSFALAYFFVEGIVSGILQIIGAVTGNHVWGDVTKYFLGAVITNLPAAVLPNRGLNLFDALSRGPSALFQQPDAKQVVGTLAAYVVVFAVLTGFLIKRRDVLQ
jgi:ABC-2 type transport system permease protein